MNKVALLDDAITSKKLIEKNVCGSFYINDQLGVEKYDNQISDTDTHSDFCAKIIVARHAKSEKRKNAE